MFIQLVNYNSINLTRAILWGQVEAALYAYEGMDGAISASVKLDIALGSACHRIIHIHRLGYYYYHV